MRYAEAPVLPAIPPPCEAEERGDFSSGDSGNVAVETEDLGAPAVASPSGSAAAVHDEALWSRRRTLRLICLYKEAKGKPRDYKCVVS